MVNGVPQVRDELIRRIYNIRAAAKSTAQAEAQSVSQAMKALAPEDQGELIRSIRVEGKDSIGNSRGGETGYTGVAIKAGDETTIVTNQSGGRFQNARLQEFGTKTRPATPFFFVVWKANRRRVRAAITRAIRKAWTS